MKRTIVTSITVLVALGAYLMGLGTLSDVDVTSVTNYQNYVSYQYQ